MIEFVYVWFILSNGVGYIEPQRVENPPCGIEGGVIGVQIDRVVNPTAVLWPDPLVTGKHCRTNISERVAGLVPGEYHIATTIFSTPMSAEARLLGGLGYYGHDPHITGYWFRHIGETGPEPVKPKDLRKVPGQ